MTENLPLPDSFSDLVGLCAAWCLADSNARSAARVAAGMDEIRTFYDALIPHAERALSYLSDKQLGQLDAADSNLLKLLLALAEIGPAIEWFGQPRVIDGYEESKFPLVLTLDDTARQ